MKGKNNNNYVLLFLLLPFLFFTVVLFMYLDVTLQVFLLCWVLTVTIKCSSSLVCKLQRIK